MEGTLYTSPPLTTVRQPCYEMGKRLVENMLDLLAGKSVLNQTLPAELVVRQSCGCSILAVEEASRGPAPVSLNQLNELDESQKQGVLGAMQRVFGLEHPVDIQPLFEELLKSFLAELLKNDPDISLKVVDDILRWTMETDYPIAQWGMALSAMRNTLLPLLHGQQVLRAENFWMAAQIMVGEAVKQKQQRYTNRLKRQNEILNELRNIFVTSFEVEELMRLFIEQLPRLEIPGCYVALYENPLQPTENARLVLAYQQSLGEQKLTEEQVVFPARQLLPAGILKPSRLVIEPLYFRKEQIGFALLEMGPREGNIYETLRGELSGALQAARLVSRVEERSVELARQNYILDMFMENVPDSIYFKDVQSRFTRLNKALLNKLQMRDYA
jgi:hypothetical protein